MCHGRAGSARTHNPGGPVSYFTSKEYGARIVNGRIIGMLAMFLAMFFVLGPLIEKCSKMPGSAELQAGQRIMYQMAGRENLRQVGFFEDYPKARPSDFVTMISDPEHALWPPPPPDRDELVAGRTESNRILMPSGLIFSPGSRQTRDSDEIVYLADDENRQIILRGYSPGEEEMTYEYVWEFPTKAGKIPIR